MKKITFELIAKFKEYLTEQEKSTLTIEKYVRELKEFKKYLSNQSVTKKRALEYKSELSERLSPQSVNCTIAALNSFFEFVSWTDLKIKPVKIQKQMFINKKKELSKSEYTQLINCAKRKGNYRLYYLMQTICSTGIRVSEVKFVTVEALEEAVVQINCKGKVRLIMLPKKLCAVLRKYVKEQGIEKGPVFVTKNGKPLDRSNIWHDMKKLCEDAHVSAEKVFPHNLRHLFARVYYSIEKDIVRLADILGHTSVNTTRIYTMETGEVHRRQIEKLGLLLC